jgi:two-component system, OmpR family, response regulator
VRLLVVEDEARLARALKRGLTADGFTVDVAPDGVSGLTRARDGQYDAVLLDVMLPGLSGYEVVRRLRAEDNWVPVMMVSAKDGPYDQADGLDYGADDYLTKPFDYVVLLARLRALLRRQSDPRPPVLSHGDVRLDPATREVTVAGAEVALSRREYELLEFFLRHPDRVVTKIELLDRVWDARGVGYEPNTVEVYVGYLRRKLGPGVIDTVRGAGYRLAK